MFPCLAASLFFLSQLLTACLSLPLRKKNSRQKAQTSSLVLPSYLQMNSMKDTGCCFLRLRIIIQEEREGKQPGKNDHLVQIADETRNMEGRAKVCVCDVSSRSWLKYPKLKHGSSDILNEHNFHLHLFLNIVHHGHLRKDGEEF